jgi:hypothetical protein
MIEEEKRRAPLLARDAARRVQQDRARVPGDSEEEVTDASV